VYVTALKKLSVTVANKFTNAPAQTAVSPKAISGISLYTLTGTVCVTLQPSLLKAVTVYVILLAGTQVGVAIFVLLRYVAGAQLTLAALFTTLSCTVASLQSLMLSSLLNAGSAATLTLIVLLAEQPKVLVVLNLYTVVSAGYKLIVLQVSQVLKLLKQVSQSIVLRLAQPKLPLAVFIDMAAPAHIAVSCRLSTGNAWVVIESGEYDTEQPIWSVRINFGWNVFAVL